MRTSSRPGNTRIWHTCRLVTQLPKRRAKKQVRKLLTMTAADVDKARACGRTCGAKEVPHEATLDATKVAVVEATLDATKVTVVEWDVRQNS